MLNKDFVARMQALSQDKEVVVMQAHMDPFYYDSSDTEPNSVIIVVDDEGSIWEVVETDVDNNMVVKSEIIES